MHKVKSEPYLKACEPLSTQKVYQGRQKKKIVRKKPKRGFFAQLRLLIFCYLLGAFVLPYSAQKLWGDLVLNRWHNSAIHFDACDYVNPTTKYTTKNYFLGSVQNLPDIEDTIMDDLYDGGRLPALENQLMAVANNYSNIKPHIFVWDYMAGRSAKINSSQTVATASIIKVPILFELFRLIDKGIIKLNDKMLMEPVYVTGGSGHLQFKQSYQYLTVETLAQLMIQDSDNTATNMLLSKVGGMNSINRNTKLWGVSGTQMGNWLPDLGGTNVTTAEEMGKILYNLDNPELLSLRSRTKIVDIMSNVKNVYLIQAGIGRDAEFVHKTGNIGSMIGDAGIVEMPNGHKYIVVIMVERPHNAHSAKDFIIEASRVIYNYMAVN